MNTRKPKKPGDLPKNKNSSADSYPEIDWEAQYMENFEYFKNIKSEGDENEYLLPDAKPDDPYFFMEFYNRERQNTNTSKLE